MNTEQKQGQEKSSKVKLKRTYRVSVSARGVKQISTFIEGDSIRDAAEQVAISYRTLLNINQPYNLLDYVAIANSVKGSNPKLTRTQEIQAYINMNPLYHIITVETTFRTKQYVLTFGAR